MIPAEVNIEDLAAQLSEDGVAYSAPELARDAQLNAAVAEALRPGEGIAVVDVVPGKAADMRDVAQELADAAGLNTVLVQWPGQVSAVSQSHSRGALEAAQGEVPAGVDQVTALEYFHAGLSSDVFPWAPVLTGVLLVAVVAAVSAYVRAVR
ncbi:DUF6676 family protein [Corynebacterium lizhenjunii]|uniref:Rv1476 family membrane protein n=1 Tax=Corynebacterium lizhenjunii TaxID=2709394 RepID=UPI0013ED450C|nr:DUF6676 family protein [Corynebacterium lizhenjunii]